MSLDPAGAVVLSSFESRIAIAPRGRRPFLVDDGSTPPQFAFPSAFDFDDYGVTKATEGSAPMGALRREFDWNSLASDPWNVPGFDRCMSMSQLGQLVVRRMIAELLPHVGHYARISVVVPDNIPGSEVLAVQRALDRLDLRSGAAVTTSTALQAVSRSGGTMFGGSAVVMRIGTDGIRAWSCVEREGATAIECDTELALARAALRAETEADGRDAGARLAMKAAAVVANARDLHRPNAILIDAPPPLARSIAGSIERVTGTGTGVRLTSGELLARIACEAARIGNVSRAVSNTLSDEFALLRTSDSGLAIERTLFAVGSSLPCRTMIRVPVTRDVRRRGILTLGSIDAAGTIGGVRRFVFGPIPRGLDGILEIEVGLSQTMAVDCTIFDRMSLGFLPVLEVSEVVNGRMLVPDESLQAIKVA